MARTETVLQAFVASPSDVGEERKLLEDVVRELNATWRKKLGLSIELLKWETHATPNAGADPQSIINAAIEDDYDIFIGIMWSRFGSETPRHGSGTEEEFRNAHKRWTENPDSVRIMFYFNESGISPTTIDPGQIKKIQDFRKSLGNEGVLYWHYKDSSHFAQILRLHLSRVLQEWERSKQDAHISASSPKPASGAVPSDEDIGLLDAMETFENACLELTEVGSRISSAMFDIGGSMNARTAELNALEGEPESSKMRVARRIIVKSGDDLDRFTARIRPEIKNFSAHNVEIAESSSKIASLAAEFRDSRENLGALLDGLDRLLEGMASLPDQVGVFRDSIGRLPRVSIKFNQSKSAAAKVVDDLIESIETSLSVLKESRALVAQVIN